MNIANLEKLLNAFDKKISVRVGIIGDKAYQIHEGSGLTNAELGAVHEFGATINHPGGTPYKIKENGQAQFVKKGEGVNLPTTKPHTIEIPARAFLRDSILSAKGKRNITKRVEERAKEKDLEFSKDMLVNKVAYQNDKNLDKILLDFADLVGFAAWEEVNNAFEDDKIKPPTKPVSKQKRKYNPNNPTLVDTGQLQRSISYEVKENK